MKPYYLTTPLYYVNDKPHIGHAYTNVLVDTFARFQRFSGRSVFFLTGTDEHGEKIEKSAEKQGVTVKDFVDSVVPRFKELWKRMDISYDYFIRTTDADHKTSVYHMISVLKEKGDIYTGTYKGWYCTPCESFWTSEQLVERHCPDCKREVHELSEENYFFRMSRYQKWLVTYIQEHPEFIQPVYRRNEVLGFLNEPLADLCISRPRARLRWGISFPDAPEHVIYVWFDALTNYISAAGYGRDEKRFNLLWPADVHMVGKDILRHHAVYWPVMLHALDLALPKTIFAHGWWTISGAKVSKSLGNIVDPLALSDTFGVDGLRYYFLHEVTLGADGAYSAELLTERYNKDLANDLGNLLSRTLSMLERYRKSCFPELGPGELLPTPLEEIAQGLADRISDCMNHFAPKDALDEIWKLVRRSNQFIEEQKPWILAKEERHRAALDQCLAALLEAMRIIGTALTPFLPETASKICKQLGVVEPVILDDLRIWRRFRPGVKMEKPIILFRKIEIDKEGLHHD